MDRDWDVSSVCYPPGMDPAILGIIASVVGTGVAVIVFAWRVVARLEARLERRIERSEDAHRTDLRDLAVRMDRAEEARQSDMREVGARMDRAEEARQSDMREVGARMDRLERGQAELRERMAKLEGLLEGLREAVTGRRAA